MAVIGAGPAGFYAVQHLFKQGDVAVEVDMFDRLPTPFGLVRHGVAPDHQKIKSVTVVYDKLAGDPRFRFFGNVDYGQDLTREDLARLYHQVVFCTGAQSDRRLGIPGEDLAGSHPATEFVAWYNGHPDFADHEFDLGHERAVVIGVGNVAVDVARILCRTPAELRRTDIADHALAPLAASRIREVVLMGRRGPAQAAFTNPELKELGELEGASACTRAEELALDPASLREVERDKAVARKVELLRGFVGGSAPDRPKRLTIRFLVSPTRIIGAQGRVAGLEIVRNELVEGDGGRIQSRPTDITESLEAGLVLRSVGYRGVPLPGLPFREDWGVVPNEGGRVEPGIYVAGWIKRGPSGVIGTNKPDALETVRCMLEDVAAGRRLPAEPRTASAVPDLLRERGVRFVSYADWKRLDALEIERGSAAGRPRVKLIRRDECFGALDA